MIYEGSRYETADLLPVKHDGVPTRAVFAQATKAARFNYDAYVTQVGDRWDLIADRFYGDAEQWWRIAEANPEIYDPAEELPANYRLRIPRDPIIRR